ncbi:DUF2157 domain-containing protein [Kribbella sp. NPDC048928]|uniref:DUF2157 domain-containing protein n=1 Tax=Kribbella sp. NPDC048928 TaxID=3364111 RepID=UPI003723F9CE
MRVSTEDRSSERELRDRRGMSLVVEALAYLGGVIILVGATLISADYWDALGHVGQLALVGGGAAVMLLAGAVVRRPRAAFQLRVKSVLWLIATAGTGAFLALFADRVLDFGTDAITLTAGTGAAMLAAVLWWCLPVFAQQAAFFVATMLATAAAVAQLTSASHLPGLAVWGTGLIWFLLGVRGTVGPRRPVLALAAAAGLVGAGMTIPAGAGAVLALCTVVAVVVVAVLVRDLLLLAVGAVGALNVLPAVISRWFPGDLAAPLALLVVGALLVAAAVYTAVRGKS